MSGPPLVDLCNDLKALILEDLTTVDLYSLSRTCKELNNNTDRLLYRTVHILSYRTIICAAPSRSLTWNLDAPLHNSIDPTKSVHFKDVTLLVSSKHPYHQEIEKSCIFGRKLLISDHTALDGFLVAMENNKLRLLRCGPVSLERALGICTDHPALRYLEFHTRAGAHPSSNFQLGVFPAMGRLSELRIHLHPRNDYVASEAAALILEKSLHSLQSLSIFTPLIEPEHLCKMFTHFLGPARNMFLTLQHLSLESVSITDEWLSAIDLPRLRSLKLVGCNGDRLVLKKLRELHQKSPIRLERFMFAPRQPVKNSLKRFLGEFNTLKVLCLTVDIHFNPQQDLQRFPVPPEWYLHMQDLEVLMIENYDDSKYVSIDLTKILDSLSELRELGLPLYYPVVDHVAIWQTFFRNGPNIPKLRLLNLTNLPRFPIDNIRDRQVLQRYATKILQMISADRRAYGGEKIDVIMIGNHNGRVAHVHSHAHGAVVFKRVLSETLDIVAEPVGLTRVLDLVPGCFLVNYTTKTMADRVADRLEDWE